MISYKKILYCVLANVATMLFADIAHDEFNTLQTTQNAIFSLAVFAGIFALTSFIRFHRVRKIIENFIVIIVGACAFIDIFLLSNFYSLITPIFVEVYFGTNLNEAGSFLATYLRGRTLIALGAFVAASAGFALLPSVKVRLSRIISGTIVVFCICGVGLELYLAGLKSSITDISATQTLCAKINALRYIYAFSSVIDEHQKVAQYREYSEYLRALSANDEDGNGGGALYHF